MDIGDKFPAQFFFNEASFPTLYSLVPVDVKMLTLHVPVDVPSFSLMVGSALETHISLSPSLKLADEARGRSSTDGRLVNGSEAA